MQFSYIYEYQVSSDRLVDVFFVLSMNPELRLKLKKVIQDSIRSYFLKKSRKGISKSNILDKLFPQERRIRSLIGGLETSMGTVVWQEIAKELARNNGFEVIESNKLLQPDPFPIKLKDTVNSLIDSRTRGTFISTQECVNRLREALINVNSSDLNFVPVEKKGYGVDVYLKKDGVEYLFDVKSPQSNVGDFPRYCTQLLDWYSYRFSQDSSVEINARIAFTFNQDKKDWYEQAKSKIATNLDPKMDIFVENEFWDFCSGYTETSKTFTELFEELRNENFHDQFHDIFYPNQKD